MARKVLIITYYFNQEDISGPVRLRGLVKYLPEHRWEATVLTVKCNAAGQINEKDDLRIVETGYEHPVSIWGKKIGLNLENEFNAQSGLPAYKKRKTFLDICLKTFDNIFVYPEHIGWYKPAIDAGALLLEKEPFDVIFSSSGPVTSHLIASHLSKQYNVPWTADFRDLWTQNCNYPYSKIRKVREREFEIRTISSAKALTTVSQPLADKLSALHKGKKIYSIPNGFDLDIVNTGSQVSEKFTIRYTGYIYKDHHDPKILFEAIKHLLEESKIDRKDVVIDFYGQDEGWLQNDVDNYELNDIVNIHGIVSRDTSLQKQRESQVLLLLTWNDPDERGIYSGKIFEYLAAKRPILALGQNENVVSDLIKQTDAGFFASNVEEAKEILLRWYLEYKSSKIVNYCGLQSEINKYTHREMAKKFVEVFGETLEKR